MANNNNSEIRNAVFFNKSTGDVIILEINMQQVACIQNEFGGDVIAWAKAKDLEGSFENRFSIDDNCIAVVNTERKNNAWVLKFK